MTGSEFPEKFIAFYDILGWKHHVRAAEEGRGLSLADLGAVVTALGSDEDRRHFEKYGPTTCPQAPRIRNDLDFRITVASDCAIVSAEVSPAGLVNLVSHCWTACFKLLSKGIMCRGYIKRGRIQHTAAHQFGTGLNDAIAREKQVSAFRQSADERGTPFIEVDRELVRYVNEQPDACVKEMFSRLVEVDGELAAVFPFKRLNHSFMLGFGMKFDPEKERASVNVVRGWIHRMKEEVQRHVDPTDASAVRKAAHYIRMLDAQLVACDKTEEAIDQLMQPFPARRMSDTRRDTKQ
jgi:hypothetical protein